MLKFYIVDAFTDTPFGGNTAGVVLLDEWQLFPEDSQMRRIAAELRYSETAFVRQTGTKDYHVRYFTPTGEVELCGHATIATFSLLHQLRQVEGVCHIQTKAGNLRVEIGERVMMEMAAPQIVKTLTDEEAEEVYQSVGLDRDGSLPVQIVSTGLPDIMLPVSGVEILNALQPDMDAVKRVTGRHQSISIHAFALGGGYTAHVRDFAPGCGIPEESATGTANAALTHYLVSQRIIQPPAVSTFLQGEAMGHPSEISTSISTDGKVYVGGRAVVVARGELLV